MAYTSGQVTTSDRTVGVKVDMDEAVNILTPVDVPLQQLLPTDTTNEIKIEWMEEELLPQTFTSSARSGAGPWTLTVDDSTHLRVNDLVVEENETDSSKQWYISTVTDATTIIVTGFNGNSTAPTAADTYQIVGQIPTEGGDPVEARSNERENAYNYTQLIQESVKASRTARRRGQRGGMYGVGDPYDHDLEKKFKELAIRFERSLVHGRRYQSGDKRFMGGLGQFITTNTTSGAKANITTILGDAIRKNYDAGGDGQYTAVVSPAIKVVLDTIDASLRQMDYSQNRAGYMIEGYQTSFGKIEVVVDRHLPRTRGFVLSKDRCPIVNFDDYFHEVLAKTGDGDVGQVVAEKSLKVKDEAASGIITVTDA